MPNLTNEIVQDDEKFRKWLYGDEYEKLKASGYFDLLDSYLDEMQEVVLIGGGSEEPQGILKA